ncbi:hypothetical protein BP5796_12274 [Coleophoma crateriformis]|uniref:Xylanolytic transcriptional activator regulatory domain-containing protein n=1 Tax=Coleophoma crateriformis TaxID=565419 RepID=A0A3D8QA57_9HELO|nr:hypothetical protein BP5796_12274 [Coleophoma crateriformis]
MPKAAGHDHDHDPTDYLFHCSVTGFGSSASSKMQLYYGASSSFAFLQQVHIFLSDYASVKEGVKSSRKTTFTAEALAELGYDELFFGTHSSDNMAYQLALSPRLLPWDTASMFLDMYMKSTYYILPLCEEATLRRLLSETYVHCTTFCQTPDSIFITAVLAVGATLTDENTWADSLFFMAKAEARQRGEVVNIRAVQTLTILAELSHLKGRPNSASLYIGAAAQMARAAGLHRNESAASLSKEDDDTRRERRTTFWCLYALDRKLSLGLGRPAAINDLDVALCDPHVDEAFHPLVAFSRISNEIYYQVYGSQKRTLAEFCGTIQGLREKLLKFHTQLTPQNYFPLTEAGLRDSAVSFTTHQIICAFDFFHALTITLKPCLVLSAVSHRELSNSTDRRTIPPEWSQWLDDTSSICCRAASHVISLYMRACTTNPIAKRLRHSRYFLEEACFILLFDVIRDPTRRSCRWNLEAVREGLRCFSQLSSDKLIEMSSNAIVQLLETIQKLFQGSAMMKGTSNADEIGASLRKDVVESEPFDVLEREIIPGQVPLQPSSDAGSIIYGGPELGLDEHIFNWTDDIQNTMYEITPELASFETDFFDLGYYLWTDDTL